jgi:BirA family transcriptional regulator, biotin operon repressor / biotin---[acetyl-CoA-carboxylase] ligase
VNPGAASSYPHIRRYAVLDSTSDEARRLAAAGEQGPLWITAERQTAGRGRRGRSWISEPGNLFATLLLGCPAPLKHCAQLSFAAALATGDAVASFAPNAGVTLKWPNDVLLDGRKTAGILLEATNAAAGKNPSLLIGVGINLASFPELADFPPTSLAAVTGSAPAPDAVLARLAVRWDDWFALWHTHGFPALREAWLARAAGLGDKLTARAGERELYGVFEDMDQDGALLLRCADGALNRVTAGEVFLPG